MGIVEGGAVGIGDGGCVGAAVGGTVETGDGSGVCDAVGAVGGVAVCVPGFVVEGGLLEGNPRGAAGLLPAAVGTDGDGDACVAVAVGLVSVGGEPVGLMVGTVGGLSVGLLDDAA